MIQYFPLKILNKNPYLNSTILLFILLTISRCASVKQVAIEKDATRLLNQSAVFSSHFTGFSLYDIELKKFIANHNSTLKFTPASNAKLLTAYTSLKTFGDSIPSLVIQKVDSGLLVSPLGDPTFLYSPFPTQNVFQQLKSAKNLYVHMPDINVEPYGSGWAWDDYIYDYQPQRSIWPIYGNTVSIKKNNDTLTIAPKFFKDYVEIIKQQKPGDLISRDLNFNLFTVFLENDTSDFERIIPFEYSNELLFQLLKDTLEATPYYSEVELTDGDTIFSHHIDSVLIKMLKPSDNFLAEQLLLMAARKNGFAEVKAFINQVKSLWLNNLTDFVWVDGSGLSRYNLISPVDQVRLLNKCLDEFGWDRMTALLPTGGEGTLDEWYLPSEEESPYIFAKTGTLSNNHNLSGYLITKSGKRLIFSFMSNHYIRPTNEVKKEMEAFLAEIRLAY